MRTSGKQPLKRAIKQHFEREKLSERQLRSLEDTREPRPLTGPPLARRGWLAIAVGLVLALGLSLSLYWRADSVADLEYAIAAEVAGNHLNLKPMEVRTDKLRRIREYFTELDFMPMETGLVSFSDYSLLGGRYCSIQGIAAAQLRVSDNSGGEMQSLYQTEYRAEVFDGLPVLEKGEQPAVVRIKGLQVKMWVENGLVYAVTSNESPVR